MTKEQIKQSITSILLKGDKRLALRAKELLTSNDYEKCYGIRWERTEKRDLIEACDIILLS